MDVAYSYFGDDDGNPPNSPEKFTFIELQEHETESPKSSNETKTGKVLHSGEVNMTYNQHKPVVGTKYRPVKQQP